VELGHGDRVALITGTAIQVDGGQVGSLI